jgi:uncharacterized membrane-anchored protein YhcB (DUF1043 family)
MLLLTIGLVAGAAVGSIVMSLLSIAAYQRGYANAMQRRDAWRSELRTRHAARSAARTAA